MAGTVKLNSEQQQKVVEVRKDEHLKISEIAARFDCSTATILRVLHRHSAITPRNAVGDIERVKIERLSREKKRQREIAREVGLSVDSIRAVQKSLGLQPQPNKHLRGPLTAAEKRKIARLRGQGKLIKDIAARLSIRRSTVAAVIEKMGVVPGLPERKLLAMKRAGWTQVEIACKLRLNHRRVFRWFRAHGFARPRYRRFQPTTKELIEIIELSFAGRDSAKSIARKLSLPYDSLLKLIHKIRRCATFLPTPTLDSYLPMKHRDQIGPRACEEESMMYLLDCARRACADCHLPPDPRRLVAVAIAVCAQLYLRERAGVRVGYTAAEQQKMVNSLSPRFMGALDTLRSAEQAVVH